MKKYHIFTMKHRNLLTLGLSLFLFATAMPAFSQVSNDNEDEVYKIDSRFGHDFVPGQVIVKMKDGAPAKVRRVQGKFKSAGIGKLDAVLQKFGVNDMEQLLPNEKPGRKMRKAKAFNGTTIEEKDLSQLYLVKMDEEKAMQSRELVKALEELQEVEFAEPNYKVFITGEPTGETICPNPSANPLYSQQWGIGNMVIDQLWTKPIVNGKRPVIAIIDTGVDITHPDLVDNLWTNAAEAGGEEGYDNDGNGFKNDVHGWDFINNTGNIRDFNSHGTHVAGIAAAADNGVGIVGANPRALIMSVSVMQSDGTGDIATVVKGIDYAVQNGATVLNMSLGTYANSKAFRQALERAYQSAVIVAAAGNDGIGIYPECGKEEYRPMFPAAYSFVLGVQATKEDGSFAGFSNFDCDGPNFSAKKDTYGDDGYNYEMSAPGVDILSTVPNGNYKRFNGTSMAAPLVAGGISALQMVKEYENQEILWGDLLHSASLIGAYDITERPAELTVLGMQFNDRQELTGDGEADYSNDGQFDAGETISIYPVVRTVFGPASNIKLHLEMGDEYEDPTLVTFSDEPVDFGMNLSPYGKGVSQNPLTLTIRGDVPDNRHIKMKMVATCDGSLNTIEQPFTIIVTNMVKISGLITEDRTLTADHVYFVNDNIGVLEGVTLTIEPGARLEFSEGVGLSSFGKLVADGTPEKPIIFTGHNGAIWNGVSSHENIGRHSYNNQTIYTNDEQTLFTLLPTETTPIEFKSKSVRVYYGANDISPSKVFQLSDYIEDYSSDFSFCQELLTDPNYLTPAVLQMLSDWEEYLRQYPTTYSQEKPRNTSASFSFFSWYTFHNPRDAISYCKIDGYNANRYSSYYPYMKDCTLQPAEGSANYFFSNLEGERITCMGAKGFCKGNDINRYGELIYSNIVNNFFDSYNNSPTSQANYSQLHYNNYFNNFSQLHEVDLPREYLFKYYSLAMNTSTPAVDKSEKPSYLGTSREDIIRPYIYEIGNAPNTFGQIDLSNMRTTPVAEAHGIVWKVVVNGKDAQDEFEDLAPLGVGRHKFEVYFNRPMNKAVAPQISFGVREPYTQQAVAEDGSWNEEGTIYTAYKTITGKTKSDGLNRIYVYGAEDNEFFEIPYEKTRFNINIQAAGSMATGFAAEAGLGRVNLTWNNENNNFEDAMGFNVYRYGEQNDTIRINQDIVDIDATSYIDYEVVPGETYYYYYKVLSTDLQEYDISNVVAVTPLTASKGDANGDTEVDVLDVITTVNYAAGQQPKPFIFEAADMNEDLSIDILDVIGIIKQIMNPTNEAKASVAAVATYTIEDGTLYVESPVELAGVQVRLSLAEKCEIGVADDLKGFEHTSAWLSDNDYLFLAYNMSGKTLSAGKHALLHIGDAKIGDLRLSDGNGRKVEVTGSETTRVNRLATDVMSVPGIYDLQGRKISGKASDLQKLPKGIYIVNGEKVVR